ncbi:MAG TPA: hypothetical protein VK619_12145 [Pyrinomonadaceae bacterium]|nr:hypothetical protein [Pyrinomonadaceae bacterium]
MKSLGDFLSWIIGGIAFAVAMWQLVMFVTFRDANGIPDMMAGGYHLLWAIVAAVIACACVVVSFVRHPHVEEEIHITK